MATVALIRSGIARSTIRGKVFQKDLNINGYDHKIVIHITTSPSLNFSAYDIVDNTIKSP